MASEKLTVPARRLAQRIDTLACVTDQPGKLTRTFLSPAMRQANGLVGSWMREAGLTVREDAAGNLVGRLAVPGAKTFVVGSHLDTVRDAGRFDGALGVLLAISAVEELRSRGIDFPFSLEVVGFSEEEGVRFSSAYLGSKGFTGTLKKSDLALCDPAGVSIGEALQAVSGNGPLAAAHRPKDLLGYFEVHIEQGPVLESRKLAVGVVTGIAGQTRSKIQFKGKAGHAGTTPMALRRDALAGAAEFALAAETLARAHPPLVATIGTMAVAPGASNVIPALANFTLDLRHPADRDRLSALNQLRRTAEHIARRRGLSVQWTVTQDNGAVVCSEGLTESLARAVKRETGRVVRLASGAGHDGVVMSEVCPVAMLFVRCRDGLSHHPDEFVTPADLRSALAVTVNFLEDLALQHRS
jgi:allantoate deiminase